MSKSPTRESGTEPESVSGAHSAPSRSIRIEAPADVDPMLIAQVALGAGWLLKAERAPSDQPFKEHKPLAELYVEAMAAYREQFARMLDAIDNYIDKHTALAKAARPLLTTAQLHEIASIIRDYHTGIAIGLFGRDSVAPAEVKRLVDTGVLPKKALAILDDAFTYGQLLSEVRALVGRGVARVPAMTLAQIRKRIERRPLPLTSEEQFAKEWAKRQAATHVRGLGNRVAHDFETVTLEADQRLRRRMQSAIRNTLDENIERRETWRKLKSDLGHQTEDWSREFGRIAATEKQRAMQEGLTQSLIKREGDPRTVLVAKIPTPVACDHCVRLHLVGGHGSRPRVFRLSDLQSNGTNVGRRANDWKAIVGPTHPWCECALVHIPEGWGFNEDGELVPNRTRKGWRLDHDLKKALHYGDSVPERGVTVRVGDPEKLAAIEEVIARTPPTLFTRKTGITLITTDHPNQNSHLVDHDFAYWTGNEIRIMSNLPVEKVKAVLEHEFGHVPNVYLMHKLGSTAEVEKWHAKLFAVAKVEGFVSEYASTLPIECAAEVTRMYLYDRKALVLKYPRQFAFVHRDYRPLIRQASQIARSPRAHLSETHLLPLTERLDR